MATSLTAKCRLCATASYAARFVFAHSNASTAPDTISSDIHALSGNSPGKPFLPWVMSKFLDLGFTLEQVVALTTSAPAGVIGRVEKLGTLQAGAPADISILELVEEPVDFVDTRNNHRRGTRWLRPVQTVRAGVPFGPPYPQPFTFS